jgi:hypothetical protein
VNAHPLDVDLAITIEERAHRLRMAMLCDPTFMEGLARGVEDERQGRMLSLEEFTQALDLD